LISIRGWGRRVEGGAKDKKGVKQQQIKSVFHDLCVKRLKLIFFKFFVVQTCKAHWGREKQIFKAKTALVYFFSPLWYKNVDIFFTM